MTWSDFVRIIGYLAWPTVALTALLVLREPLKKFFSEVGGRITGITIAGISLEIARVPEARPPWTIEVPVPSGEGATRPADVRRAAGSRIFDSYSDTLFANIAEPGALDYAVVDLGRGDKWLSSRLFLFAVLLRRMRGLRRLVFLEQTATTDGAYLACVDPQKVRWALAQRFPWLELAWARAYSTALLPGPQEPRVYLNDVVTSDDGGLSTDTAKRAAVKFLRELEWDLDASPPAQPIDAAEWVELTEPQTGRKFRERAEWLTADRVAAVLRTVSETDSRVDGVKHTTHNKLVTAVLRAKGDFVAVLDGPRFEYLLDRRLLVDQVIRNTEM